MRMEDSNPGSILHLYSSTFYTLLLFHSATQHSEYVTFHQQKRMTSYIIAPPSPSECFLSRELLLQHQRSFPLAEVFRPVLSIGQIIRVAMLRKARLGMMPTHRIGSCFNINVFFLVPLLVSSLLNFHKEVAGLLGLRCCSTGGPNSSLANIYGIPLFLAYNAFVNCFSTFSTIYGFIVNWI